MRDEDVYTINRNGDIVKVTRVAALKMLCTRRFSVWNYGVVDIWRGTGKTREDAEFVQAKYPKSQIVENPLIGV